MQLRLGRRDHPLHHRGALVSETASRGPQGEQGKTGVTGKTGRRGEAGMSRGVRRAVVFLFALNAVIGAGNLMWTSHAVSANDGQRCTSLLADASIPLPPDATAKNPSREWERDFENIARARADRLGCK
jgi:hypothetical protein